MDAPLALQEFLEFVIGQLITDPEKARIAHETSEEGAIHFRVVVAEEDAGRIVGKNGYTISSIKSLLAAGAERSGLKASVKLYSVGEDGEEKAVSSHSPGGHSQRRRRRR